MKTSLSALCRLGSVAALTTALVSLAALSGCSEATGYTAVVPLLSDEGFAEKDAGDGLWHVSYAANGYTTRESIQTYWLYHCAEFTLQHGFDGFEIVSRLKLTDRPPRIEERIAVASNAPIFVPMPAGGDTDLPFHMGADIRLLSKPFTPMPGKLFDAAALKRQLDPLVNGPKCGQGNVCPHDHSYLRIGSPP